MIEFVSCLKVWKVENSPDEQPERLRRNTGDEKGKITYPQKLNGEQPETLNTKQECMCLVENYYPSTSLQKKMFQYARIKARIKGLQTTLIMALQDHRGSLLSMMMTGRQDLNYVQILAERPSGGKLIHQSKT